jgi:hypothetical protein
MILSVLSGQKPVTDAIAEANISRQTYYQIEERAIQGMLMELGTASGHGVITEYKIARRTIEKLEKKLEKMEEDKRRLERLLLITRKVVKSGPMTLAKRSPRKRKSRSSSQDGTSDSAPSTTKETTKTEPSVTSTPMKASGGEC